MLPHFKNNWEQLLFAARLISKSDFKKNKYSESRIRNTVREILMKSNGDKINWQRELAKRGYRLQKLRREGERLENFLERNGVSVWVSNKRWSRKELIELGERYIKKYKQPPTASVLIKARKLKINLPPYQAIAKEFGSMRNYHRQLTMDNEFVDFEFARRFVRKLKLKNYSEWFAYRTGKLKAKGKKPRNIPSSPEFVYKGRGWRGYGDFLGTGNLGKFTNFGWSFNKARAYVRRVGIKDRTEWNAYCKSGKKPKEIPAAPWRVYSSKGWISLGDWLGTGRIANQFKNKAA